MARRTRRPKVEFPLLYPIEQTVLGGDEMMIPRMKNPGDQLIRWM